jgi:hypothetical protein
MKLTNMVHMYHMVVSHFQPTKEIVQGECLAVEAGVAGPSAPAACSLAACGRLLCAQAPLLGLLDRQHQNVVTFIRRIRLPTWHTGRIMLVPVSSTDFQALYPSPKNGSGKEGFLSFAAAPAPVTGRPVGSSRPSCTSTFAWSQMMCS